MSPTTYWVPGKRPFLAILPAVLIASGCMNDAVSSPRPVEANASMLPSPQPSAGGVRVALGAALDDALDRVIPTLHATPETIAVAAALRGLSAAFDRSDVAIAPLAAQADRALTQLLSTPDLRPGELADITALQLVLSRVDALK